MKYEVGDIVRVRKDLKAGKDFGRLCVCHAMAELAGKLVTISSVNNDDYHIEEDDGTYYWIDEFFENEDEDYDVDKTIKKVLSEMTEETKDTLIKQFIKGENKIAITASPIYKTISRTNGVSIQQIVGTKYGVAIINKDGMVTL